MVGPPPPGPPLEETNAGFLLANSGALGRRGTLRVRISPEHFWCIDSTNSLVELGDGGTRQLLAGGMASL